MDHKCNFGCFSYTEINDVREGVIYYHREAGEHFIKSKEAFYGYAWERSGSGQHLFKLYSIKAALNAL